MKSVGGYTQQEVLCQSVQSVGEYTQQAVLWVLWIPWENIDFAWLVHLRQVHPLEGSLTSV
nr:MAG TPA: hypothetical protein [Caudoviricetes sp.]